MQEIRELSRDELSQAAALERELFSDPWSIEGIQGTQNGSGGYVRGLFEEGRLLGYVIAAVVWGEGELFRIGVSKRAQGKGLGGVLLDRMLSDHPEAALWRLDVRAGNMPAIRLYESRRFRVLTRNKNFYREPVEDGLLMMRESC